MLRTYLIDGYNLLHQVPEFAGPASADLESRRQRLLRRLVGLSAQRRFKITLVFDGAKPHVSKASHQGMDVYFVPSPADNFIRSEIASNERNRHLVIVSSDSKDIGAYARLHGLEWMTSEQFWAWITTSSRPQKGESKREEDGSAPPGWTSKDDDDLKKIFEGS